MQSRSVSVSFVLYFCCVEVVELNTFWHLDVLDLCSVYIIVIKNGQKNFFANNVLL